MSATKPEAAGLTLEEVLAARVASIHHFHGEDCLCGYSSARSRSRTEHILAAALPEVSRWLRTVLLGDEVVEAAYIGYDARSFADRGERILAALTAAVERVEALGGEGR